MLNEEQLDRLNQIFHQEIVPIFEENPELVDEFMMKIKDYEQERKQ